MINKISNKKIYRITINQVKMNDWEDIDIYKFVLDLTQNKDVTLQFLCSQYGGFVKSHVEAMQQFTELQGVIPNA